MSAGWGKDTKEYGIDTVTGLYGNQAFRDRITQISTQKKPWEIMIFGIDNFKHINDFYSYTFGDVVLRRFSEDIQKVLEPGMELFRLDGDGFGILCHREIGDKLGEKFSEIQELSQTPKLIGGMMVSFSVSAGVCGYPEDGEECDVLYRNARIALAAAKKGNKRQCVFYRESMSVQAQRDMLLLDKLKQSVEHDFEGFYLNFQPLVKSDTKELYGCEALLRWENPYFHTGISPFVFVPILENSGLILKVGQWVLEQSMKVLARWLRKMPCFQMNINVSAKQFEDPDFVHFVQQKLKEYQIDPTAITLELTESSYADFSTIRSAFEILRKQGLKTAFDDFGTGYASLDIFRNISGDELKVDRSFLERITYDVTDQVLLKSIIDMCRSMNIIVCVEGIENKDIEHIVGQMQPHLLQGYLYNRPMGASEFEAFYFGDRVDESVRCEDLSTMVYTELRPAKPLSLGEIADHAYAGIFQVGMDKEFTFLACNEGYRRMLGYTAREIEEKFSNKALGFVHPDDMQWVNEEIRRQLGKGDTITVEFRIVRADGRPIWIMGSGNVVRTPDGNASLIVDIINVDEIKRKTLKRLAECDIYEKILDQLPTGIKYIRYNPDFTIDYISPGFLSILGYTKQEVFGEFQGKYINLIYEEDRQKVFNDALEQVKTSDVVTLRYRSVCKDGKLIWLETVSRLCPMEGNDIQHCCSSVVNVTDIITEDQKSHALNVANRFQLAAEKWGDVIFEYNYRTGKASFSESFESILGYHMPVGSSRSIDLVVDEDKDLFYEALEAAKTDEKPRPVEVRIYKADGSVIWCMVHLNTCERIGGEAVSVIGKLTDVTAQHFEQERLKNELSKDSMTGLLNKGALEMRIRDVLNNHPDGKYALFLLDADNFKSINEQHGHFAGDMILSTVAKRLKNTFRKEDIIGRAGGDEFMIFMEYNGKRDVLERRGNKLLETLNLPIQERGANIFHVSFSIGIACFPQDGHNFSELFQRTDMALYRVKRENKGKFLIIE